MRESEQPPIELLAFASECAKWRREGKEKFVTEEEFRERVGWDDYMKEREERLKNGK
jgi:hypothetical protein